MRRSDPYKIFLIIKAASAVLFAMIFTASSVYQITVAGLSVLQLVLVGTTLEIAAFVFETPTGVIADVYSRRLSVIIGWFLIGLGFLVEGSFPLFWTILLAQVLWGLGYTFTSGATEAWLSDEIGEAAAGKAFLRGNQVGNLAALVGIGLGMGLGAGRVSLPIQVGGVALMLLSLYLALSMPETGFKPLPRHQRSSWQAMWQTFRSGLDMVRGRPSLIRILAIGLIYGLYSEGFDRLWTKHLLENFSLPFAEVFQPVMWVGALRIVSLLLAAGASGIVHRHLDTQNYGAVARALMGISVLLIVGLFTFALAPYLAVVLLAFCVVYVARNVIAPIYTAWVNQRLEPGVRATVISMSGQVDSLGQIAGGPLIGLIGSAVSVRAALFSSACILTPVLALYARAMQRTTPQEKGLENKDERDLA
jgi:DHA3 family tetracycline resistance protein-like MFS transporter